MASAVAMMFLASSVRAQEGGPAVGSSPNAKSASVKCVAGNDCKNFKKLMIGSLLLQHIY